MSEKSDEFACLSGCLLLLGNFVAPALVLILKDRYVIGGAYALTVLTGVATLALHLLATLPLMFRKGYWPACGRSLKVSWFLLAWVTWGFSYVWLQTGGWFLVDGPLWTALAATAVCLACLSALQHYFFYRGDCADDTPNADCAGGETGMGDEVGASAAEK